MFHVDAKTLAAAIGLGAIASLAPVAAIAGAGAAASKGAPVTLAQAQAQGQSFDDEKIEAFATAETKVQEIRTTYIPQLESAETEAEQVEIRQQAGNEMVSAVNETPGITVEEYNAIVETAAADPDLAERLDDALIEQGE